MKTEFSLPEFAFLDDDCHLPSVLTDRTVVLHVRTATILEFISLDEIAELHLNVPTFEFNYKNRFNVVEHYVLAVHYEFADFNLNEIKSKAIDWFCKYMDWEDENIAQSDLSKLN